MWRRDSIVLEGNLGSVTSPTPIQPAQHKQRPNDRVADRQVLNVEEVDALPKNLRLMVALDADALTRVTTPKTFLK
jgi:hypothetical protein